MRWCGTGRLWRGRLSLGFMDASRYETPMFRRRRMAEASNHWLPLRPRPNALLATDRQSHFPQALVGLPTEGRFFFSLFAIGAVSWEDQPCSHRSTSSESSGTTFSA